MAQVFFVTGAASGIGRHLVSVLAGRGERVLAADVSAAGLERAARDERWPDERVHRAELDVRREEDWRVGLAAAEDAFGRVDVLLNVAGVLRPGFLWETTADDVDRHLDVNVKGVIHGMRVVGESFRRARRGHIVNMGSLASLAPVPGLPLYTASKFAVRGVSLAVAQELAEYGVAVTVVMPDAVATPMLDVQVASDAAALTFSGRAEPLTVEGIARLLLDEVLPKRPLEATIPWERGLLARVAGVAPRATGLVRPLLVRRGLAAQAKRRR